MDNIGVKPGQDQSEIWMVGGLKPRDIISQPSLCTITTIITTIIIIIITIIITITISSNPTDSLPDLHLAPLPSTIQPMTIKVYPTAIVKTDGSTCRPPSPIAMIIATPTILLSLAVLVLVPTLLPMLNPMPVTMLRIMAVYAAPPACLAVGELRI